jgi:hypothetical protein
MNHYLDNAAPGEHARNDPDIIRAHVVALRGTLTNKLKGYIGAIGAQIVGKLESINGLKG